MEEKNPIQVADRIFQVIETLATTGPIGLIELSKTLDLNKSTVHRILNSLIYMGYVKQDPSTTKYSLSFKIWEIANQLLTKIDILDVSRPYLKELVALTSETVHLVQIDGINAVYIDKVEAYDNPVRLVSKVGKSIPLYCSGVGKAILADMTDEQIRRIWDASDLVKYTDYTIVEWEPFIEKINWIRKNGFALDDEENELGVRCIAVSLNNYNGNSKYAISISAPVTRMTDETIKKLSRDILDTKEKLLNMWR